LVTIESILGNDLNNADRFWIFVQSRSGRPNSLISVDAGGSARRRDPSPIFLIHRTIPSMSDESIPRASTLSRNLKAFVDSPVTNLVKGIALLFIGLSEASHSLFEDVAHLHLRVGHGLVIIGVFSILDALPHIIDGIEAHVRYQEARERKKARSEHAGGEP